MRQNTELDILNRVGRLVCQPLDIHERLQLIAKIVAELTHSGACSVYAQEAFLQPLKCVYGRNPEQIEEDWTALTPVEIADPPPGSLLACNYVQCSVLQQIREDGEVAQTVLVSPIAFEHSTTSGTVALWNVGVREYTPAEVSMLSTLASQILGILKNTCLHCQIRQKQEEHTRIYEVGKALTSTLALDELLDLISRTSAELTNARGCVLRLLDRESGLLEIKSSYGDVLVDMPTSARRPGEGIAGKVAETNESVRIDEVSAELRQQAVIKSISRSVICVPITGKEGVIGTIAAFDKNPDGDKHRFSEDDVNALTSFAGHAAIAIEHARFYERMEELSLDNLLRLRELSILYHINTAMRSTVRLNKLLRIILTGVTIGGGLGFNRAILFMVNHRARTLKGILGVGPGSGDEAGTIWQQHEHREHSLVELMTKMAEEEEYQETSFEKLAKSIWMPLEPDQGILARTVLEQQAFNITDVNEHRQDCQYIAHLLDISQFATVPLIVREKVIGILYVDNKFNNVAINEDDMNFLQMFANQAALAIDNAMLYSNLERRNQDLQEVQDQLVEMEKMTALGKMAASIAHEIRNPIICVGGFARRLLKDDTLNQKHTQYVNIILEEATRLETILQDVLVFSRETRMNLTETDINSVIKSALEVLTFEISDREVEVNTCFFKDLDTIMADAQQLKQVCINLITNALQQVPEKKGLINIMTYNSLSVKGGVMVEISDNGGGIDPEIIANIFNPFFTTKGSGTGLGLAIIRKIIENHKGTINVKNRPGAGVTFVIHLPTDMRQEEQHENDLSR